MFLFFHSFNSFVFLSLSFVDSYLKSFIYSLSQLGIAPTFSPSYQSFTNLIRQLSLFRFNSFICLFLSVYYFRCSINPVKSLRIHSLSFKCYSSSSSEVACCCPVCVCLFFLGSSFIPPSHPSLSPFSLTPFLSHLPTFLTLHFHPPTYSLPSSALALPNPLLSSPPFPTVQPLPLLPRLTTTTTTPELLLTQASSSPHLVNSFLSLTSLPIPSSLLSNPAAAHCKHLHFTFPPFPIITFIPFVSTNPLSCSFSLFFLFVTPHSSRLSPLKLSKPLSFPFSPFSSPSSDSHLSYHHPIPFSHT